MFLAGLDAEGRHDLFAIDANARTTEAATFLVADGEEMRTWIDERQGRKNLYVSVNRAKEDAPLDRRLNKASVGVIRAITLDIDPVKRKGGDPSGEHFRQERIRLSKIVDEMRRDRKCPPTKIVDSGGGFQAWWYLEPKLPATSENVKIVEGIGRTLRQRYGGDATWNIAGVMRLPGTVNLPTAEKQKNGQQPAVASIVDGSTGHWYSLATLTA